MKLAVVVSLVWEKEDEEHKMHVCAEICYADTYAHTREEPLHKLLK